MILSDGLVDWVRCWEYPKADLKAIVQVCWEDCLVVPLVPSFSEVSQGQGARRDTIDFRRYFCICHFATLVCVATPVWSQRWRMEMGKEQEGIR